MNVTLPPPSEILRLALSTLSSMTGSRRTLTAGRYATIDYGIDVDTGFVPRSPLPRLTEAFTIWEDALDEAAETLCLGDSLPSDQQVEGVRWRATIKSWPVLDIECIHHKPSSLQRCHSVLAWILHFYTHSTPKEERDEAGILIPRSIAIPLVSVSKILGIAPVLCYADTVLWNWQPIDPSKPFSIDNLQARQLFTGTDDEAGFYKASLRTELAGVELLHLIERYNSIPTLDTLASITKVSKELTKLKSIIEDLNDAIQSVRTVCDPKIFYWNIRPWYNGCNPNDPNGIDIFLDVDHKLQKRRRALPNETQKPDRGFMDRMRRYMPGRHREYLESLDAIPVTVRDLALSTPSLREPFDACVAELQKLRELHMRIACLYILSMSRSTPPGDAREAKVKEACSTHTGHARGTGGNEVAQLLKAGRDATKRTYVDRS